VKTIGIVGGIGPESTIDYYRQLLARASELAGTRSPQLVINSVDFFAMRRLLDAGDDAGLADMLVREIEALERAGAAVAIIAANTPHMVFDRVQPRVALPLVSIVEATRDAAEAQGLRRLGLLGTRFTTRATFFPDVFAARGLEIVVPEKSDLEYVHEKYVGELVEGRFLDATREGLVGVMQRMCDRDGIDGVILGGTELPLILRSVPFSVPLLDTTRIHVDAVLRAAISTSPRVL
jgi:aspartate racemase